MYISILGRQPALGAAELERLYSSVAWFSHETVTIKAPSVELQRLGGSQKIGRVVAELPRGDWVQASRKLVSAYTEAWRTHEGKITLGISAYGFKVSSRDVQKTGIILKKKLKEHNVSLRLIPNDDTALSTATSHHNKLGLSDNKVELIIVQGRNGKVIIAESIGSQNITAYAKRDQGRPKRDAFVGMLPPKLAQIMINLASPATAESLADKSSETSVARASRDVGTLAEARREAASEDLASDARTSDNEQGDKLTLLDPFCGTGVLLQEAALIGYDVYGTDLAPKMIDFSGQNLDWLKFTHRTVASVHLEQGDAMDHIWRQPIDAVACETYLGQPFSAPPSPSKLHEVRGNCNHIISSFLKNIAKQLEPGTPLCIGVPAWRANDGTFTHLPLTQQLGTLGYQQLSLKTATLEQLLYYRDDQVVARELLVLVKK
jgi:tRNA G10  N-methylase Trm11